VKTIRPYGGGGRRGGRFGCCWWSGSQVCVARARAGLTTRSDRRSEPCRAWPHIVRSERVARGRAYLANRANSLPPARTTRAPPPSECAGSTWSRARRSRSARTPTSAPSSSGRCSPAISRRSSDPRSSAFMGFERLSAVELARVCSCTSRRRRQHSNAPHARTRMTGTTGTDQTAGSGDDLPTSHAWPGAKAHYVPVVDYLEAIGEENAGPHWVKPAYLERVFTFTFGETINEALERRWMNAVEE
jgi:hypothetical protein